ncbi:MAG: glycosyltransferase [Candidatus Omnitrophica bacterium CG11_big_fil_rev_8_21_14_0_20_42_13]|uniref:Glycosyltransferase n=1 Tax=Candidatus Ghiorseimicrobium undicola TaxID=1974746 RepID=A0A2H0LWP4_9BACT|nr:MAG: glycosyltransferase [Candidatus Omnitrophica bacterium CG11_big_fil_rev_8_21_14_0_20_42_13]
MLANHASKDNVLMIFAKYPMPGFVKTRLAKSIGRKNAASLYKLFVEAIIALTEDDKYARIVYFMPQNRKEQFINWLGADIKFAAQCGNSLGQRMFNAFKDTFKKGAKKVIAIGTDSPFIDNELIINAFDKLNSSQCVIGPSLDGGYYLLGTSRFMPHIFKNIAWGSDTVAKATEDLLKRKGVKYALLGRGFDVDNTADLVLLNYLFQTRFGTG